MGKRPDFSVAPGGGHRRLRQDSNLRHLDVAVACVVITVMIMRKAKKSRLAESRERIEGAFPPNGSPID
jgi:hypothetical protein